MICTTSTRRRRFGELYRLIRRNEPARLVAVLVALEAVVWERRNVANVQPVSTFSCTYQTLCYGDPCQKHDATIYPGQYMTMWSGEKKVYTHMTCWPEGAK